LAEQFAIAARLYAESVALLATSSAGVMSPEEYGHLRQKAETAQQRAEAAGLAFEEHLDSHRCSVRMKVTVSADNMVLKKAF
jgi:hypothetical protein